MNDSAAIDGHAEEVGTEVVPAPAAPPATLFRTDDPVLVVKRATEVAEALAPVLREKNLTTRIGDKDHVQIEGWQTLGAMLGVTAVEDWTRETANGWEARVEARTLDGRVIGAAESMCERSEAHWKDADGYAIRSMAQTRASSKALASVLRFVVTLAGYSGTPAEEVANGAKSAGPASEKQVKWVLGDGNREGLLSRADFEPDEKQAIWEWASVDGKLTRSAASKIIEALKDDPKKGKDALLREVGPVGTDVPADAEGLPAEDGSYDGSEDDIPF